MELLNLRCSEPTELSKVMSIAGIFPGDAIEYQGRSVKVDFSNISFADTPVMQGNKVVAVIPKGKIITSGGRVRATSGQFTSKDFAGFIGQPVKTGAVIEPLEFDGDVLTKARLKNFTVEASGRSDSSNLRSPSLPQTDDDAIAESLFQASGGGPQAAPEPDETNSPVNHPPAPITTHNRTANDADEQIAQALFNASRGQAAAPDHADPRRPERKTGFVGSGYQDKRSDENEDERLAQELFDQS